MSNEVSMSQANRPTTFYHGTSIDCAVQIQTYGFDISLSGTSSGQLLGKGVYCTPVLAKAVDYAKGKPMQGVVLQLACDLGNCKTLKPHDPMCKTWQHHNFDSAWMPTGANERNMAENCIKDPARIKLIRIIAGNTWLLERAGMFICPLDGRLAMMGNRVGSRQSGAAKRKHDGGLSAHDDPALYQLLCAWKLEAVVDLLAYEGIVNMTVLSEELHDDDIGKMAIGGIYKKRLGNLLNHVHSKALLHANQISSGRELLLAMRAEPSNVSVQVDASAKLVVILDSDHLIIDEMVAQNMLPLLVTAVSSHITDITLHQNTITLVDLVVSTKINIMPQIEDLLSATFFCVKNIYKDKTLQIRCISTLNRIAAKHTNKDDIQKIVVGGDRIDALLAVMHEHVMHRDVQTFLFRLLPIFFNYPGFVEAFVIAGGIARVLSVMKTQIEDKKMQDLGWNVVTRVMHNDVVRTKKVMLEGGVRILLSLIGSNFTDKILQLKAVRLLDIFARNDHRIFCCQGIAGNAIDIIVTLMQMYKEDEEILCHCLNTLHALADENKMAIVTTQVMDLLRNAIQFPAHAKNANLMGGIAQLLCRLSSKQTQQMLTDADFVPLILSTMSAHQGSKYAQEQCITCLHNLCSNIPSQYIILTQRGGAVIVFESMIAYPDCMRIHEAACLLLRFVSWDVIEPEFVRKNGISVLLSGMKTHMALASNQVHGLALLINITNAHPLHHPAIFEASGIDVIVEAMKTHGTNILIQSKGLLILWHLSYSAIAIVQAIPVIVAALEMHHDNKRVVSNCFSVLVAMFKSPDAAVKKLLRDSEALNAVAKKILNFSLNAVQQEMLSSFITILAPEQMEAQDSVAGASVSSHVVDSAK